MMPRRFTSSPSVSSSLRRFVAPAPAFTLLELLVALGMVAIISLSMFQSLRVAVRAKNTAEAAVAPSRSADIAMDLLRADFTNVMPPNNGDNPNSTANQTAADDGTSTSGGNPADQVPPPFLSGNFIGNDQTDDRGHPGDEVILFTTSDGPTHDYGDGEIHEIDFKILTVDNDHVLVRHVASNLLNPQAITPDNAQTMDKEIVCRGVSSFNVRYYDGTEWLDSWDAYNTNYTTDSNGNPLPELPAAVEITLELDRKNPDGSIDTTRPPFKFTRVFPLPTSNLINDLNAQNNGSTQ